MEKLLILQLMAHFVTDFYGQNEHVCQHKLRNGFRSGFMYIHAFFTFLIAWLFSLSIEFVWFAMIIGFSHLVIDGLKSILKKWKYVFFVDQLIHLSVIITVVLFYSQSNSILEQTWMPTTEGLLWILGVFICLKPTNVIIKEVLKTFEIKTTDAVEKVDELNNAGRLIGNLERMLTLLFVFLCQFEAIGFLLAAKSILRFKDTATAKTEYVLVGTLLSYGIAILIGTIIINLTKPS